MTTAVRQTSKAAYLQHGMSGALISQRLFILQYLKDHGPRTRQQLSEVTGIPINSVSGRANELLNQGLVTDDTVVTTAFGRKAHLLEAV